MSRSWTWRPRPCAWLLLAWLFFAAFPVYGFAAEEAERWAGVWTGQLAVGGTSLRIVLEWKRDDGGVWSGTMDSPDQGAFGIPVTRLAFTESRVECDAKSIGGEYRGELLPSGVVRGEWKQSRVTLPLELRRGEKVAKPARPQEPKPPFPYRVQEVAYDQSIAKIRLAGSLTLPEGPGPFPAVLLITGSGPQDRNEELVGHKPFWVLADYLTRRGIAVLRVDDRGVGGSTGDFSRTTTADFVEDALAGVAFLKSHAEIDPRRIGLVGHSEGGLIAPAAAVRGEDVAFIVLLAGPSVTGEQIVLRQGDLIGAAAGIPSFARTINQQIQKKLFAILRDTSDDQAAADQIRTLLRLVSGDWLAFFKSQPTESPGKKDAAHLDPIEAQVRTLTSPWFRYFLTYDPRPTLEKVRCPVLVLNGEKDLQVCPRQNLPVLEAALRAGSNSKFVIKELPGLNHLFQACQTGSPTEYGKIEETINPAALQAIGDWLEDAPELEKAPEFEKAQVEVPARSTKNARPPRDEADLRYWLENMVWHHRYSTAEISAATGLSADVIERERMRLGIEADQKPQRPVDAPLLVLPYPGGRHPRRGFLDGAIDPQRETKISIFTPWDDTSYVVLDAPEAVWSNLGLTYLAHTHIDTVWSKQGIVLPPLEWQRHPDGRLTCERALPNGIVFGVESEPHRDHVAVRMWLRNGTPEPLTGLRVQMCAMLAHARGFEAQSSDNKVISAPFAAARSATGDRWIIHGWQPLQRAWENPPCPCIHADPQIPDCPPGETREVFGWVSFFVGPDVGPELERLRAQWKPLKKLEE